MYMSSTVLVDSTQIKLPSHNSCSATKPILCLAPLHDWQNFSSVKTMREANYLVAGMVLVVDNIDLLYYITSVRPSVQDSTAAYWLF